MEKTPVALASGVVTIAVSFGGVSNGDLPSGSGEHTKPAMTVQKLQGLSARRLTALAVRGRAPQGVSCLATNFLQREQAVIVAAWLQR